MSRSAAAVSRLDWTSRSSTSPSLSTARHRYMRWPWMETTISSRCYLLIGLGRSRHGLHRAALPRIAPTRPPCRDNAETGGPFFKTGLQHGTNWLHHHYIRSYIVELCAFI